nr:putative AC transposase [Ipomoea batatas]
MEGDNSHVGGCDSFTPTPMSSPVEYPNSLSARNEVETQETQGTSQTIEDRDGKVNVKNYTFDLIASRQALACMIVKHKYSLNMVEHSSFREFMKITQPLLKMPSRNTIRGDIIKTYEAQNTTLIESMNRSSSRVALTIDMWTSYN